MGADNTIFWYTLVQARTRVGVQTPSFGFRFFFGSILYMISCVFPNACRFIMMSLFSKPTNACPRNVNLDFASCGYTHGLILILKRIVNIIPGKTKIILQSGEA